MVLRRISKLLVISHFSVIGLFGAQAASATPLDFDGDGKSDLVGFLNQADGSPNELVFHISLSEGGSQRSEFGNDGDIPAPADYDGDGITDLAIVKSVENGAVWRIRQSAQNNEIKEINFGQKGDTAITGCDFDGDGKGDAAVLRENLLLIRKSSDDSESQTEISQTALDKFYCADLDQNSNDELIGFVERSEERAIKSKKRRQAKTRNIKRSYVFAWNSSGEELINKRFGNQVQQIFAADPDGAGIAIGYARKIGRKSLRLIFDRSGSSLKYTYPGYIKVVFGKFDTEETSGTGIALQKSNDDQFAYSSSMQNFLPQELTINGTETLLDQTNHGIIGGAISSENCNQNLDPTDGTDGFLWKPVSESTGKAVVLFPREYRFSSVSILKDGSVEDKFYFAGIANGNRQHFRSNLRASQYSNNITILARKGSQTYCWLIENPNRRID